MNSIYKKLGVKIPEILLPAEGTDLTKWAVIACDQYTSQPDYWQSVEENAGQSPSTLKLIFPEIYLKEEDSGIRINNINKTMEQYLEQGVLQPQKPGFILVDRSTPHTASRKGLIVAVDLECYDYNVGSQSLIRATEGTVLDRIPPRVKIRENAPIELPHIMVLIDDPNKTVIESLYSRKDTYKKLYDFDLMQGGGHIRGWKVEDEQSLSQVASALEKLVGDISPKQGDVSPKPLLFAMGDGNHSLASAKAHWENVKAALLDQQTQTTPVHTEQQPTLAQATQPTDAHSAKTPIDTIPEHPARYALVELVNVHDDGLAFEPIHRVIFGINHATIQQQLIEAARRLQLDAGIRFFDSMKVVDEAIEMAEDSVTAPHNILFILEGAYGLFTVKNPVSTLEVGTLQSVLDELVKNSIETGNDTDLEIDYIHGDQVVTELGSKAGSMGFFLPVMNKNDLFKTVKADGVLPRKTFSMGEAEEKRYYMECRCIK